MKAISLFSGGGGLCRGLKLAMPDIHVSNYVEIEPFAQELLRGAFGKGVLNAGEIHADVRTFQPPKTDLVYGGFPCQDFSSAGKGKGFNGERSGLWSEFRRIIGASDPELVFIENVPNLIATEGIEHILQDLAYLGLNAEWGCLRAADVGAPYYRRRIFILASTAEGRRSLQRFNETQPWRSAYTREILATSSNPRLNGERKSCAVSQHNRPENIFPPAPNDTESWGRELRSRPRPPAPSDYPEWRPTLDPPIRGMVDGVPARKYEPELLTVFNVLGNAVVPQIAAMAFILLARRATNE